MSKKTTRRATKGKTVVGHSADVAVINAEIRGMMSALRDHTARISALESRLPPVGPPAEAKPTTLREIVMRAAESLGLSREHMDEEDAQIMLRVVAAVCRERATVCKGFATNVGDSHAAALNNLAHDCEQEAQR